MDNQNNINPERFEVLLQQLILINGSLNRIADSLGVKVDVEPAISVAQNLQKIANALNKKE